MSGNAGTELPEAHRPILTWRPLERQFVQGLVILLAGYAFLGKGFAYLHVQVGFPLYVGEIVLAMGLLAMLLRPVMLGPSLELFPGKLLVAFLLLGAVRTMPFLGKYGVDAVRDAALVYYGLFALLICDLVTDRDRLEVVAGAYGRVAYYYVFIAPALAALACLAKTVVPRTPGTDMPLISIKGGDIAAHVVGCVAFHALVRGHLHRSRAREAGSAWYLAAVVAGMISIGRGRGALLSVACGLGTMILLVRSGRWWRPVSALITVFVVFLLIDPVFDLPSGRKLSADIFAGEVRSIFVSEGDPEFRYSTRRWRLRWWSTIIGETFGGPRFWGGRGFGENLADAHGFQTSPGGARPLRSPHNAHMTVLARMGVPGFLLWVALLVSLFWTFYSRWRRARDAGDHLLTGILGWVICYWVAALVVSSFDVYFEGPQGGVWFWVITGVGLAAARMQPRSLTESVARS